VGCFLTGLSDHTCGNATSLPWGVDFGDGIRRHPTQLYEIAWLVCLALILWRLSRKPHKPGDLFKFYMVGYLGFRLVVEFIKPGVFLAGLTAIQWACLSVLVYYAWHFVSLSRVKEAVQYDG
ncbi:MAG TPA: prolipoprotein diacylglyceryl transferase family protein, partial [bacterium]|nr:prolipoprotein diacylglyceryl transferase family protein [bacterium]